MKKATIILGIVIVVLLAGVYVLKSGNNEGSNTAVASPTPSQSPTVLTSQTPSPFPEVEEAFGGQIQSISPQKIVIKERDGNILEVLLNDQVKYYDKGVVGSRERKEIPFSSFTVGEWIAVRGWASGDPLQPAKTVRAEWVFEAYLPGEAPDTGE